MTVIGWRRVAALAVGLLASLLLPLSSADAAWYDVDTYVVLSGPAQSQLSQEIQLKAAYGNQGPYQDPDIGFVVHYPSAATVDGNTTDHRCVPAGTLTLWCDLGPVPPGASGNVYLYFRPSTVGQYAFDASITSSSDPTPADNTSSTSVQVVADYSADMFVGYGGARPPGPRIAGTTGPEDLSAGNNGPLDAKNVWFTDTLNGPAHFVSAPLLCSVAPKVVRCNYPLWGARAVGEINISVYYEDAGAVTENVQVTADTLDANSYNNQASSSFNIVREADLSTRIASPTSVKAGQKFTLTATVANSGLSAASAVSFTDSWSPSGPGGTSLKTVEASQGTCVAGSPGSVSCSLGSLPAGSTATVTLQFVTGKPGTLTDSATATAPEYDPTPSDNSVSVSVNLASA